MSTTFFGNKMKLLMKPKGSKETTISSLPDDVICKILSNLSTKDSIRASALAKGWRNLWLHASALDLDTDNFEDECDFWDFFGTFLESSEGLDLTRFKLIYNVSEHLQEVFVECIDDVLKRGVCHLNIQNRLDGEEELVMMPLSLYSCEKLVNMTLFGVVFDAIETKLISLSCLKTMHLEDVKFDGERLMEIFISRCPVLEELVIVTCHNDLLGVVGVSSTSLRMFKIVSKRGEDFENERPNDPDVVVNAPRLEHMVISDYQCENFVIQRISPYAMVNVDVIFDEKYYVQTEKSSMIRNFLTGISKVGKMKISARTLEMIANCNQLGPLPQLANLSCLDAFVLESSWEMLPNFLGCCPNLHSLVLEFDTLPPEEANFSFVPPCFLSSLEFVELTTPTSVKGKLSETELARYFLRNCVVLEELILSKTFGNIIDNIKRIPQRSAKCKVITC